MRSVSPSLGGRVERSEQDNEGAVTREQFEAEQTPVFCFQGGVAVLRLRRPRFNVR